PPTILPLQHLLSSSQTSHIPSTIYRSPTKPLSPRSQATSLPANSGVCTKLHDSSHIPSLKSTCTPPVCALTATLLSLVLILWSWSINSVKCSKASCVKGWADECGAKASASMYILFMRCLCVDMRRRGRRHGSTKICTFHISHGALPLCVGIRDGVQGG
ncbi:hypothetical protein CC80DRAFT_572808, partial [Byssothecium circinans]